MGTKSSKTIVMASASICAKVNIYNGFHSLILFDSSNSNTIFYKAPLLEYSIPSLIYETKPLPAGKPQINALLQNFID